MSPVYINPEDTEHADCPLCGYHQAIKIGDRYRCVGNDNRCKFYGTVADAERLKQEREECRKSIALNVEN